MFTPFIEQALHKLIDTPSSFGHDRLNFGCNGVQQP
jgi:hypothetical protein